VADQDLNSGATGATHGFSVSFDRKFADELTITSWGLDPIPKASARRSTSPSSPQGNKITEAEYNGEIAKVRAMVEAKAVTWDVVDVDTQTALAGCAEGTFETIDWAKLGLDRRSLSAAT
jgi:putative spermidine/putrescine transport system substrate-binding protein